MDYCQRGRIYVALTYASLRPEEPNVHLLYVLYAGVFWRGEAQHIRVYRASSF